MKKNFEKFNEHFKKYGTFWILCFIVALVSSMDCITGDNFGDRLYDFGDAICEENVSLYKLITRTLGLAFFGYIVHKILKNDHDTNH